jgi:hypothetical protein
MCTVLEEEEEEEESIEDHSMYLTTTSFPRIASIAWDQRKRHRNAQTF